MCDLESKRPRARLPVHGFLPFRAVDPGVYSRPMTEGSGACGRSGRAETEHLAPGLLHAGSGERLKRGFDVAASILLIVASAPAMALIALAITLDSRGPVIYRQWRLGRFGKPFRILKFRKMRENLPGQGPMLTRHRDPRLTRIGMWLAKTKLDELPQFLNVLRGEMSLVGPRPEVPDFIDLDDPSWRLVLSIRPGIFGVNQLLSRSEADLYPPGEEDVEEYYRLHILPAKLRVDEAYALRSKPLDDIRILVRSLWTVLPGAIAGTAGEGGYDYAQAPPKTVREDVADGGAVSHGRFQEEMARGAWSGPTLEPNRESIARAASETSS